jgi:hypothetical protein
VNLKHTVDTCFNLVLHRIVSHSVTRSHTLSETLCISNNVFIYVSTSKIPRILEYYTYKEVRTQYLRGAKATFELTRQIIKFLGFLVDFFVAVLQREIERKKEYRNRTLAGRNKYRHEVRALYQRKELLYKHHVQDMDSFETAFTYG